MGPEPRSAWMAAIKAAPLPLAFLILAPSMRTPHFIVKIAVLCVVFGALGYCTARARPYVVATLGLTIVAAAWLLAF